MIMHNANAQSFKSGPRLLAGAVMSTSIALGSMSGQAPPASTPAQRVVLLELFTSEGCSSCPPADALLKRVNGMKLESGALIIGLSEHVTYWNTLGWTDPFSQQLFTDRQQDYGERFRLNSVYTPQMVVNGEKEMSGGDGNAVFNAVTLVTKEPVDPALALHIDAASISGKTVALTYSVSGHADHIDLYAVIAEDMASSSVAHGENAGKTLSHVAIARTLMKVGTVLEPGTKTVSLTLPPDLKANVSGGRHLVLFAQAHGLGKVLAVDSKGL